MFFFLALILHSAPSISNQSQNHVSSSTVTGVYLADKWTDLTL